MGLKLPQEVALGKNFLREMGTWQWARESESACASGGNELFEWQMSDDAVTLPRRLA